MAGKQKDQARGGVPAQWADTVEAPRIGIIDPDRVQRRTRAYRAAVWATVVSAPLLAAALFVSLGKNQVQAPPVTHAAPAPASSVTSPGRAAATVAVQQWLAQKPSPLPGASIMAWTGAVRLPVAAQPPGSDENGGGGDSSDTSVNGSGIPEAHYETDTFTLVTTSGVFWDASIEVAVDARPGGGAAPVTGVSITPVPGPASDAWDTDQPWPGVPKQTSVPGAVSAAIQSWAAAWTSGSPGTLAQAVQDPDGRHFYTPVSGVASVSPSVLYSAPSPAGGGTEMVEVSLGIAWKGQKAPPANLGQGSNGGTPTVMDLLVAHAGTAAPVVVAWGPPGSGPTLRAYQNALGS